MFLPKTAITVIRKGVFPFSESLEFIIAIIQSSADNWASIYSAPMGKIILKNPFLKTFIVMMGLAGYTLSMVNFDFYYFLLLVVTS